MSGSILSRRNDGFKTGPEIGDKVPAFTLSDQEGRTRKLDDLTGSNGLLLVFSRSAGW
jgi:peroxiredoxin